MILQCFDAITDTLRNSLRPISVKLYDKKIAEDTPPTDPKTEVRIYYDGESDFEYDESAAMFNTKVTGGLILLNENLGDERSNREILSKVATLKTALIGVSPDQSADIIKISDIELMDMINNFTRYRITFNFGLTNGG